MLSIITNPWKIPDAKVANLYFRLVKNSPRKYDSPGRKKRVANFFPSFKKIFLLINNSLYVRGETFMDNIGLGFGIVGNWIEFQYRIQLFIKVLRKFFVEILFLWKIKFSDFQLIEM